MPVRSENMFFERFTSMFHGRYYTYVYIRYTRHVFTRERVPMHLKEDIRSLTPSDINFGKQVNSG